MSEPVLVRPYGERPGDGAVQLSFTLPAPDAGRARRAAELICRRMGLVDIRVSHAEAIGGGLVACIVHARTDVAVSLDELETLVGAAEVWSIEQVDRVIAERLGRKLIVVGACIGDDAHTIGLDAILNAKGVSGVPGLEAYQGFTVHNLGSQVPPRDLVNAVRSLRADAVLVSQIVTHNDGHRRVLADLAAQLTEAGLRDGVVLIMGGPRIGEALSRELGYDAGFGAGSAPDEVANQLMRLALSRRGFNQ